MERMLFPNEKYGIGVFVILVVVSVAVFAGLFVGAGQVLFPFIPVYIAIIAAVVVGLLGLVAMVVQKGMQMDLNPELQRLMIVLILAAALILTLSAIFCWTCLSPRPREMFQDVPAPVSGQLARLRADVAEAEEFVCKYITRADQFISGDVGPAGTKDPSLVSAAEAKAREGVNMALCSDDASDDLVTLESRIERLESTLSGFTGVVFKHSYDETVPCKEGFLDAAAPDPAVLERRLAAIRTTIDDQKTTYLDPIDQKTADLQAGKASDCDKRRGATLVVKGGPKPASP
jgi:hypothetical protein